MIPRRRMLEGFVASAAGLSLLRSRVEAAALPTTPAQTAGPFYPLTFPAEWKRLLTARPLRHLGVISYSVLLWHAPIGAYLLRAARPYGIAGFSFHIYAVFPVVLAVSTLSYLVLERPFLLLARRLGRGGVCWQLVSAP